MESRQLMQGHFIEFGVKQDYEHTIGGEHSIEGAWCPNCDKPLMLHMTLDTNDPALGLDHLGLSAIPLLYCCRCALSWYDFTYVIKSETKIEIIEFFTGETTWDDWHSDVGLDTFPRQPCSFRPIPSRLQELYNKLNDGKELSEEEKEYVASIAGSYAGPEGNRYPFVDAINQVGGRSYLVQGLPDPYCFNCKKKNRENKAFFLASLTNDIENGITFAHDDVQIIFFVTLQRTEVIGKVFLSCSLLLRSHVP